MTLRPATLIRALTTGYPLPLPTTTAADGRPAHIVTEPITIADVEHFGQLRQTGNGRVRLVWRGTTSDPMLVFQNCRDLCIEHADLIAEAPCDALVVSERTKSGPGVIPSTMHQWRDVRLYGNRLADRGFWYRATVDENNEHMRADCVSVYGCTDAAFVFEGQQSKEHLLTHVRIESTDSGVVADSSFQMIGGCIASCVTAIELDRVGDPVTLSGVGVETCARCLKTDGPTTAAQPVALINCRFEADQLAGDGEMIVLRHAGPLVMIGGRYGGGKQPIPRIALRGVGPQTVRLDGVTFGAFGAYDQPVIVASNPNEARVSVDACVMQRGENDPQNTQPAPWVGIEQAVNA